jgi:hypothetical protein
MKKSSPDRAVLALVGAMVVVMAAGCWRLWCLQSLCGQVLGG